MTPAPHQPKDSLSLSSPRGALTLILSMLVLFFHLIDRQIMAILAEPIKADLGFSDTQIGLLTGLGFSLLYSVLGIPLARLADRFDRAKILAAATAVWSGMTVVTGFTGGFAAMLLARMGVAAGEAGGIPPLHSLLADLFPARDRARAFSIMQLGGPFGVLVAFLGGGYLVSAFDWRMVFFAAGALGLLLVPLLWFLMPEPRREKTSLVHSGPGFWSATKTLLEQRAFVYLVIGIAFAGMGLYASIVWAPSYLIRSFSLPIERVGLVLGISFGVLGAVAVLAAGHTSDWAQRFDRGAHALMPAIMLGIAAPLCIAGFLAPGLPTAMAFLLIPIMMMSGWQAPALAAVQDVATSETRALAAALAMFVLNLIGLGLGPLLVGVLSDAMTEQYGSHALRYALLIVPAAFAAASLFWALAARELRAAPKPLRPKLDPLEPMDAET